MTTSDRESFSISSASNVSQNETIYVPRISQGISEEYIISIINDFNERIKDYLGSQYILFNSKELYSWEKLMNIVYELGYPTSYHEFFHNLYKTQILSYDYDGDRSLLLAALKLLFVSPYYFHLIDANDFLIIWNKLVDLMINYDQEISLYALRCLHYATINEKISVVGSESLNIIFNFIVCTLSNMIHLNLDEYSISVAEFNSQFFLRKKSSFDINEYMESENDQKSPIDHFYGLFFICEDNCRFNRLFHLIFLNSLISHLKIHEILRCKKLCNLVEQLLKLNISKNDLSIFAALSIILKFMNEDKFCLEYFTTEKLFQLCRIPHFSFSSVCVHFIFNKISQFLPFSIDFDLMKNNLKRTIIYYNASYSKFEIPTQDYKFIINLLSTKIFYQVYSEVEGTFYLLKSFFSSYLFNFQQKDRIIIGSYLASMPAYQTHITSFIKIIVIDIAKQLEKLISLQVQNYVSEINYPDIRLVDIDVLCKLFKKKHLKCNNVKFFERFTERCNLTSIFILLSICYKFNKRINTGYSYGFIMSIFKMLLLYENIYLSFVASDAFFEDINIKEKDLIALFKQIQNHLFIQDENNDKEFCSYNIFYNLFQKVFKNSCSKENDIRYPTGDQENNPKYLNTNSMQNMFLKAILDNGIVYQMLKYIINTRLNKNERIKAIKCLNILTEMQEIVDLFSYFGQNYSYKLLLCVSKNNVDEKLDKATLDFSKHVILLVNKINPFIKSKNVDANDIHRLQCEIFGEKCFNDYHIDKLVEIKKLKSNCSKNNELYKNILKMFEFVRNSKTKNYNEYFQPIECKKNNERCIFLMKYRNSTLQNYSNKNIFSNFLSKEVYEYNDNKLTISSLKYLINDKLLTVNVKDKNALSYFPPSKFGRTIPNNESVYVEDIDETKDGQHIMCTFIDMSAFKRNTCIWKFDNNEKFERNESKQRIDDIYHPKFSEDCKSLLGFDMKLDLKNFDIATGSILQTYKIGDICKDICNSSIDTCQESNLLLANGNLLCCRSGKLIKSFMRSDPHVCGIFTAFGNRILINNELWDLRTFRLLDQIPALKDRFFKRSFCGNLLFSVSNINMLHRHIKFDRFMGYKLPFGNNLSVHDCNIFSKLGEINFDLDIHTFDISRDSTKVAAGVEQKKEGTIDSSSIQIVHVCSIGSFKNKSTLIQ